MSKVGGEPHERIPVGAQTLVERLPGIVYAAEFGEAGAWMYVSPLIEATLGYPAEAWIRDPNLFDERLHPDDFERYRAAEKESQDLGTPLSVEYRLRARDGRYVWIRDQATVVHEPGREPFNLGVMLDVTDRVHAEMSLRRTNESLRALFDASPAAFIGVDLDLNVTAWNPAAERIFGWSAEEAIGRRPPFVDAGSEAQFAALTGSAIEGKPLTGIEIVRRRKDGSEVTVGLSAAPVCDEKGTVTGIMSVMEDATERKRARQALVDSEERYRQLVETASNGILIHDESGAIVLANAEACRMFGYEAEDLLGTPLHILIPERMAEKHRIHLAEYMSHPRVRKMGHGFTVVGRRKDGSEFPAEIGLSATHSGEGVLVTAIVSDITERQRAQESLEESLDLLRKSDDERRALLSRLVEAQEEERRRIAGDIHDDSIQMMAAVGMRLEALSRRITDPGIAAAAGALEEEVNTAIAHLRLLVFGLRPPALDSEGLAAALHASLAQMDGSGTEWHTENRLAAEPPTEARVILFRIAQEALANVRKHSRAAHAELLLEPQNQGCLVRVKDDGVGFSPDEVDPGRLGHLGLSAMRERAQMAGGWLRIDARPGEGTIVEFWVPDDIAASPGGDGGDNT